MTLRLFLGLLAVLVLSEACGNSSSPSPSSASLSVIGTIASSAGTTISGARVEVLDGVNRGRAVVSDAAGKYALTALYPGAISLLASAANHMSATQSGTLTANASANFQLVKIPAAILVVDGDARGSVLPDGTFTYVGQGSNKGDACATEISGTTYYLDSSQTILGSVPWSLPPTTVVRPGGTFTYQFCCLQRAQADAATQGKTDFRFTTIPCP